MEMKSEIGRTKERERETQDNEDKRQGRERRSCLFLTCPLLFFVSVFI